jgi:hypothetical protein
MCTKTKIVRLHDLPMYTDILCSIIAVLKYLWEYFWGLPYGRFFGKGWQRNFKVEKGSHKNYQFSNKSPDVLDAFAGYFFSIFGRIFLFHSEKVLVLIICSLATCPTRAAMGSRSSSSKAGRLTVDNEIGFLLLKKLVNEENWKK